MAGRVKVGRAVTGIAVGGIFLALVAWRMDWAQVWATVKSARTQYLLPISGVLVLHYFFKGLRWRALLSGTCRISPWFAFRLTMVGFFMNNVFPARIGELGRPYLLSANQQGVPFSFALATLVGDKLFDVVMVMSFLLVGSFCLDVPPYVRTGIVILAAACGCAVVAGFLAAAWERRERRLGADRSRLYKLCSRLGTRGDAVYSAVLDFAQGLSTISSLSRAAQALVCSAVSFAFLAGAVYMTMLMVNVEAGIIPSLFVIGMTGIGFMLPSAPSNAGNFHFFATEALLLIGLADQDVAFSFALISHATQFVLISAVGALALVGLDWRRAAEPN